MVAPVCVVTCCMAFPLNTDKWRFHFVLSQCTPSSHLVNCPSSPPTPFPCFIATGLLLCATFKPLLTLEAKKAFLGKTPAGQQSLSLSLSLARDGQKVWCHDKDSWPQHYYELACESTDTFQSTLSSLKESDNDKDKNREGDGFVYCFGCQILSAFPKLNLCCRAQRVIF